MSTTFFIGNGLNRCIGGLKWGDLLADAAKDYNVPEPSSLELPIAFELIASTALRNGYDGDNIYQEIKDRLSVSLIDKKAPQDSLHHIFMSLPCDSVITSNYDFLLERAYNPDFFPSSDKRLKYLFAPEIIGNKKFFHPHGRADNAKSICLGYSHYMGIISRMKEQTETDSWYSRFFESDLFFIGFGLGFCEYDIIHALIKRSNYFIGKKSVPKCVFYDANRDNAAIRELLTGLSVEYKPVFSNSYRQSYLYMADELDKQL